MQQNRETYHKTLCLLRSRDCRSECDERARGGYSYKRRVSGQGTLGAPNLPREKQLLDIREKGASYMRPKVPRPPPDYAEVNLIKLPQYCCRSKKVRNHRSDELTNWLGNTLKENATRKSGVTPPTIAPSHHRFQSQISLEKTKGGCSCLPRYSSSSSVPVLPD